MPMTLVRDKKGNPIICCVNLGNAEIKYQAWQVEVGRIQIILLDTNLPQNEERHREITAHVYGGDRSTRIAQEYVLGIGGVRMLRAMGISPSVFHMTSSSM